MSVPGPTYVLDFGANLSGLPDITGSAPAGTTVTMIPAEAVNSDGTINVSSTGASPTSQILYRYTFAGRGRETWHSQFTYSGLQYLEVRGLPSPPTADTVMLLVTHAANQQIVSFGSSSQMLNTIYQITARSLEAFEGQLVANMRTSQRPTPLSSQSPGLIANIAPEYHVVPVTPGGTDFLDEPNWAKAVVVIPWDLYQVYGDTKAMSENYDAMVKWLDYEAANKASNGGHDPLGEPHRIRRAEGSPVPRRRRVMAGP